MLIKTEVISGMRIAEYSIEVPLDWSQSGTTKTISFFFREVCRSDKLEEPLPLLVYLQGGPGGKSPRPTCEDPSWLHEALKQYRVILPDQRGTGRSSRACETALNNYANIVERAYYLDKLDSYSIVSDLEFARKKIYHGIQWSILGQSYGGFISLTYLSFAPEGIEKCYIAGGLPSLYPDANEVYRRTYPRVARKIEMYFQQFPDDSIKIDKIADYIQKNNPILPNGDPLTVRRFQSLGLILGMSYGAEQLHWLIEEAFCDTNENELNRHFLNEVMTLTGFDDNPLFGAIHERIYADSGSSATWAAESQRKKFPEFAENHRPLYLTGEMIYPWMFDEITALKPFREAAFLLSTREKPYAYYDIETLANNNVPVAAAIYFDDMYVDCELSLETAKRIKNLKYWVTNEYEHDGLRQSSAVFTKLTKMIQ